MNDPSWWMVRLRNGSLYYLPTDEGDRLKEVCLAYRYRKREQCTFAEATGISGEEVVVQIDDVVDMCHVTPESRAKDDDADGVFEFARNYYRDRAINKPWDAA